MLPGCPHKTNIAIAALCVTVTFAVGAGVLNLFHIRGHADALLQESLPQWMIAHQIHQEVAELGYHMVGYGLNLDPAWWERANASTQRCRELVRAGHALASEKQLSSFRRKLEEMEAELLVYEEALSKSRQASETIRASRETVREASLVFLSNIQEYLEMQRRDMHLQIASTIRGRDLVKQGIRLSSEAELKLRQERIEKGTLILDMGRLVSEEVWLAELDRDGASLLAIEPRIRTLQTEMSLLLDVTRQARNRAQLKSASQALDAMLEAISDLIRARESALRIDAHHNAAYGELFRLAEAVASKAREDASRGGSSTQETADIFIRSLLLLIPVALLVLTVIYGQVRSLQEQTGQLGVLNRLAEQLQQVRRVSDLANVAVESCRELFPEDSGLVFLEDLDSRTNSAWGTNPPIEGSLPKGAFNRLTTSELGKTIVLSVPIVPFGGAYGVLALNISRPRLLRRQKTSARRALALTVADLLGTSLNALHLMERLRLESITDPLTKLFNRRYLQETLLREFNRARREESGLSVILVDVDHFKKVNDSHGHDIGDAVLVQLASILKMDVRAEDVVCRYGGEEFLILMPGLDARTALERAELLRAEMEAACLGIEDGLVLKATISVGLAAYPEDGDDPESIIAAADKALYRAKETGRNRVCRQAG